jgi:hypothetical protein
MPFVRVRDDGEYWAGHYEIPNCQVNEFNPSKLNASRIGDVVLVIFIATQEVAKFDNSGMTLMHPSGDPYSTIGISKKDFETGECDEAYFSVKALGSFRNRFPDAWEFLNKAAKGF